MYAFINIVGPIKQMMKYWNYEQVNNAAIIGGSKEEFDALLASANAGVSFRWVI